MARNIFLTFSITEQYVLEMFGALMTLQERCMYCRRNLTSDSFSIEQTRILSLKSFCICFHVSEIAPDSHKKVVALRLFEGVVPLIMRRLDFVPKQANPRFILLNSMGIFEIRLMASFSFRTYPNPSLA